jgi:hypothetical protein
LFIPNHVKILEKAMSKKQGIPPEPTEIKEAMKALMGRMTGEAQDWQSLVAWYGNKLPQYLWTGQDWRKKLSKKGWKWQSFLSLLSRHTQEIVRWANGDVSWNRLIEIIEADLNSSTATRELDTRQETITIDEYSGR